MLGSLSGCAGVPAPRRVAPAQLGEAEVSRLAHVMAERDRALESLRTAAVMEYSAHGQHLKTHEDIVARRPASLRVEAMSPFGVALIVAADGKRLQIFDPSKNTFLYGTANAATLNRFARIPMQPRDAVALLMGVVPDARNLPAPDSVARNGAMVVMTYHGPANSTRELGFEDGKLVLVRERTGVGLSAYEIRYADYHDIGGLTFAYQVDADFPTERSHVTFHYNRPIINGHIPDSAFVLTPGQGAKRVDLGAAQAGASAGANG